MIRKIRKGTGKKAVSDLDARLLSHPRCVPAKLDGSEFRKVQRVGLLAFDKDTRPAKFRLFCSFDDKEKAKKIPFVLWNPVKHCWIIPASFETLKFVKHFWPDFMMTPDAMKVVIKLKNEHVVEAALVQKLLAIKGSDPDNFAGLTSYGDLSPYNYQKKNVHFTEMAWRHGWGIANFSEQGTGKTATTLVLLDRIFSRDPDAMAIIFAPKPILHPTWVSECRRFSKHIRPYVPLGSIEQRGATALNTNVYDWEQEYSIEGLKRTEFVKCVGRPNLFLLNHEAAQNRGKDKRRKVNKFIEALGELMDTASKTIVIADEGHKFSNSSAKQTKGAAYLIDKADHFMLMTGTPGMPEKYYGILKLIDKRIFRINKGDFERRYIEKADLGDFTKITGYNHLPELRRRADQFSIRVKQEDCSDIPEWQNVEVSIEMSKEQTELYNKVAGKMQAEIRGKNVSKTNLGAKLHGLRNVANGYIKDEDGEYVHLQKNPKLEALIDLIEDELPANLNHPEQVRKIIVTCQYKEDVRLIVNKIRDLKRQDNEQGRFWRCHDFVTMTSEVKDTAKNMKRTDTIRLWNEDQNVRIWIGVEAAFKEGLNLVPKLPQVCDVMAMFSSGYLPDSRDQVIKRIIRGGQTRKVRIVDLCMKGTIDETIVDGHYQKMNIIGKVNGDNVGNFIYGRRANR